MAGPTQSENFNGLRAYCLHAAAPLAVRLVAHFFHVCSCLAQRNPDLHMTCYPTSAFSTLL